jgi:vacuolar-type H+-ATPase subunit H
MAPDGGEAGAGGAVQQVQEKGREAVSQAQQQAKEKTEQVRGQAGDRVRSEVDRRSTQAGEQTQTVAAAVRKTAEHLRSEGNDRHAEVAEKAAERVEAAGSYLRDSDGDKILSDVEDFARGRPWVVGGAAALIGFVASRFLKASSAKRYEERTATYRATAYEPAYPPELPTGYPEALDRPYVATLPERPGEERFR